jgi:hypothetical protein
VEQVTSNMAIDINALMMESRTHREQIMPKQHNKAGLER